ncbi:MAG: hypothetical protein ACREO3_06765 [Arenimonas sp.]
MILGYARLYAPDGTERAVPDAAVARRLLDERAPDVRERMSAMVARIGADRRTEDAILLGTARLGHRHGSFGSDFHDYHNERHALELADRRLARLLEHDTTPMQVDDASALMLFAACHDLRQRETRDVPGPVGGNEAASAAECFRILEACGFDEVADRHQFVALELMIAGSTFDARPAPPADPHGAELASIAGGALARGLFLWLDAEVPEWRLDQDARRGERLGRMAADLDTANVGEEFGLLCESALRLCREREMRMGRPLDSPESGPPSLGFLGMGQVHYFFELHRFCSREGERVFGPQKTVNGAHVRATSKALAERFSPGPPPNGQAVIDAFLEISASN